MLGTTHQLIALVAALWLLTLFPVSLGLVLGPLAVIAVMIGALTPDLDQPTANVWRRVLGGRAIGNIFQYFSGGHRHMTHSLLGIIAIGAALRWIIATFVHPDFVEPAGVLWYAFMIGYISHPIADTLTDLGVPWLWPLKIHVRIPPGPEEVRVTTGSFVEIGLLRGALIIAGITILMTHSGIISAFFNLPF